MGCGERAAYSKGVHLFLILAERNSRTDVCISGIPYFFPCSRRIPYFLLCARRIPYFLEWSVDKIRNNVVLGECSEMFESEKRDNII